MVAAAQAGVAEAGVGGRRPEGHREASAAAAAGLRGGLRQVPQFQARRAAERLEDATIRVPVPAVPGPSRAGESRPLGRTREPIGAAAGPSGAREAPPLRVEKLLEERERIEQLYEKARKMEFGGGRDELERSAMAAEDALERQVRELSGAEQRELQSCEQARGLDRGGPSRQKLRRGVPSTKEERE